MEGKSPSFSRVMTSKCRASVTALYLLCLVAAAAGQTGVTSGQSGATSGQSGATSVPTGVASTRTGVASVRFGKAVETHDFFKFGGRKAKMPNFDDPSVAETYGKSRSIYSPALSVHGQGFRMPESVNHLKVKTNSSNPFKNEKNVTLNLNIPASVSGFLLEEIDLKYVKKSRKKSTNNNMSNLLIKYFTNRSSNLHLSSVTKEEESKPAYRPYGDLKERRDETFPGQNREATSNSGDYLQERPFRYRQKYPLRLLEKIRAMSNNRNKRREGKRIFGEVDHSQAELNKENGEDFTRYRRSSSEDGQDDDDDDDDDAISESDLQALESILKSKTVMASSFLDTDEDRDSSANYGDHRKVNIPQLYNIFEDAVKGEEKPEEISISSIKSIPSSRPVLPEQSISLSINSNKNSNLYKKSKSKEAAKQIENGRESAGNWFTKNVSTYLLSVLPQSFRSSMFPGSNYLARRKRSAVTTLSQEEKNEVSKLQTENRSSQEVLNASAKLFSDPRQRFRKTGQFSWGPPTITQRKKNSLPNYYNIIKRPILDEGSKATTYSGSSSSKPTNQVAAIQSFDDVLALWQNNDRRLSNPDRFNSVEYSAPTYRPISKKGDPSKRLSKLDYYFSTLDVTDEPCKERMLCEVARDAKEFAPLADMLAQETDIEENLRVLRPDLLVTPDGARLMTYIDAANRGTDRRGCELYQYRCRVGAHDVIDTNSLALWKEIASWLTVKVLSSSLNERH